ncbi:hypothetical protein BC827DRAFT_119438 [Russula dissimulans]|nr:hypothetical protein BC827DRAFT_119438 [Russula dissimulans]
MRLKSHCGARRQPAIENTSPRRTWKKMKGRDDQLPPEKFGTRNRHNQLVSAEDRTPATAHLWRERLTRKRAERWQRCRWSSAAPASARQRRGCNNGDAGAGSSKSRNHGPRLSAMWTDAQQRGSIGWSGVIGNAVHVDFGAVARSGCVLGARAGIFSPIETHVGGLG